MRALGALLLLALAGSSGCDAKKGTEDKPDAAAEAGPLKADLVIPVRGCRAVIPGGSTFKGMQPGVLSLAAASGKALLVSSSTRGEGAASRSRAERLPLDGAGAAEGTGVLLANDADDGDGGPDAIPTFAAAIVLGSELTALTYGRRGTALGKCADGEVAQKSLTPASRGELLVHACHPASALRAAGRGTRAVVLAPTTDAPTVGAWLLDGNDQKSVSVEKVGPAATKDAGTGAPTVRAPAVAIGASSAAVAYVVGRGGTATELHVARLGGSGDSEAPVRVEILDKEHVGTVALAFDDDTLHVVWSSYMPEKKRSVLRWAKWPAGGAPTTPQAVGTGVLSATTPALAIDHGRFVLAWTEGDDPATTVKIGASRLGIAAIPGVANVVSGVGSAGEAPAVAIDKRRSSSPGSSAAAPQERPSGPRRSRASSELPLASSRLLQETSWVRPA